MPNGPKIKLPINLHRIARFFPLKSGQESDFDYNLVIDRQMYDEVAVLLGEYGVADDFVIREFCFLLLWVGKETGAGDNRVELSEKFVQMWEEIDGLKHYLLYHRVTSIILKGEAGRSVPGDDYILEEDINIDRICDGIRSVFREEFEHDKQKRRSKGQRAWQRRKMISIRNNILNYFTIIPELDELSLEEQNYLIDKLSVLVGIPS